MSDEVTEEAADPEAATKREGIGARSVRPSDHLVRGTLIGRYVVIDKIGEGGMGVVYSAFDPELDRKVAIKLLQVKSGGSSGGEKAWIQREAQALARLSHPNVVAVHDVGSLPGDRVFVAMELIEGISLRDWLKEKPRRWQEVVPILRAAGTGLAAAHAAGLVHRDFKPENVMVGTDGRVRVMDFGLARPQGDAQTSSPNIEAKSPLNAELTATGSLVGTPAYMSPQLYAGEPADAKSDQFAFGVTLFEALYRARPFRKDELIAKQQPPPRPKIPIEPVVPAAFQRVVLRAIAADPDARFPGMAELLVELAVDPGAARRRWWLACGGALALGATAAGVMLLSGRRGATCGGIEQRLGGTWDPAVKQAVRRAFEATNMPIALPAYAGVERVLDAYAKEWADMSSDSCRATRIRGEQTEDVLSLRTDCFDQRLEELHAFTQLLVKADEKLVTRAALGAGSLEPLRRCSNVAQLRAPGLPPPEATPRLMPVRGKLAEAKAALAAGRFGDATTASTAAGDLAHAVPSEPNEAEARKVEGLAMSFSGNPKDGVELLVKATWLAMRSRRDDVAADAALYVAQLDADMLGKTDEAKIYLELGTAAVTRLGVDHRLERRRLEAEGIVRAKMGDLFAAAEAHEKAFELAKVMFALDAPQTAQDELMLASTYARAGAFAKAVPRFEHGISVLETTEGKDHPDLGGFLSSLGVCYAELGESVKARIALERAVAIREHAFGANSPMLIPSLNNVADVLVKHGAPAEAMPVLDRAMAIAGKLGQGHPLYLTVATTRGEALTALHQTARARAAFAEVIAVEEKSHSPVLATTLTSCAVLELGDHKWAEAARLDQRAIDLIEASGGKDSAELRQPVADLARAQIGLGHSGAARPLLERAIAIGERAQVAPEELAPVRDLLNKLK